MPNIDVWSTCLADCFTGLTTDTQKATLSKFYGASYFVIDSIKYRCIELIFYSSLQKNKKVLSLTEFTPVDTHFCSLLMYYLFLVINVLTLVGKYNYLRKRKRD